MTTILVPRTVDGVPPVPDDVRVARYDVDAPPPAEAADADAVVVWGNPADRLAELAAAAPRVRWVQTQEIFSGAFGACLRQAARESAGSISWFRDNELRVVTVYW